MNPVTLTLKGIYSYQQEQTIDFEKLGSAHLFGIFGPVGSGKSTILEAMTFALYDRTERLNRKGDNLAHNMKNLRSDELLIRFHFWAGENQPEEYCFEVSYDARKKSSTFKRTQKVRRKDGRWVVKELRAEEVLGLSYENFRRTVIIPQGKFQEFLQLGSAERTRMLRELFGLHRFDLGEPVKILRGRNANELANLEGQLQSLGEVDAETVASLEQGLAESRTVQERLHREMEDLHKKEQDIRQLQELFEKICVQKEKLAEMAARQADFRRREERLELYQFCVQHFKAPLEKWADVTTQLRRCEKELAENQSAAEKGNRELTALAERLAAVQKEFHARERLRQTAEELEGLVEIRGLMEKRGKMEEEQKKWREEMGGCESEIADLEKKRQETLRELKHRKAALQRWDIVPEVAEWFSKATRLKEQIQACEEEIAKLDAALAQIRTEVQLPVFWATPQRAQMALPELWEELEKSRLELEQTARAQATERKHLQVQVRLAEFADALQPGEPCPLCGATEHPAPMDGRDFSGRLEELEAREAATTEQLQALQAVRQNLARLMGQQEAQLMQRENTAKKRDALRAELAAHRREFCWADFDADDPAGVERTQQQIRQEQQAIKQREEQQEKMEEKLQTLRKNGRELQEKLHDLSKSLAAIESELNMRKRQIRHIEAGDYADLDTARLLEKAEHYRKRSEQIEAQYRQLEQEKNVREKDLARLDGEIHAAGRRRSELRGQLEALERDLQTRVANAPVDDLTAVEQLLARPLDIDAEKAAIQQFHQGKHAAEMQLQELQKEAAGRSYDAEAHAHWQAEITRVRAQIDEQSRAIGRMEGELATARKNLEKRRELEKKRTELKNRAANLDLLANMFRGSGFVNFVSRIHLEQLCHAANERFRRLTRQQLQLELTHENDFLVRDYLHGGETRSIKTLSGGQTFQASLSLALALADSVRQLARAPHNFFFLDEGFGTLDRESLRLVFETLKSLRRENRIVGLISHVEELQEEIDVYLRVENDEQHGSRITASWE